MQQKVGSDARRTMQVLGKHVEQLTGHLLDASDYNAHGHATGRQGAKGHPMPKSDAHLQDGAHVPQDMYGALHVDRTDETKDYGPGDIGYGSRGAFASGGGTNYETTNVGDTPDADSAGPTGY
jgi:hypothetical protein